MKEVTVNGKKFDLDELQQRKAQNKALSAEEQAALNANFAQVEKNVVGIRDKNTFGTNDEISTTQTKGPLGSLWDKLKGLMNVFTGTAESPVTTFTKYVSAAETATVVAGKAIEKGAEDLNLSSDAQNLAQTAMQVAGNFQVAADGQKEIIQDNLDKNAQTAKLAQPAQS